MSGIRPPPPQGSPPSYAFVTRVYNRNLRPVVIAIGALSALWTLLWAIDSFREISIDRSQHYPQIATFALVLGILYITACVIEIFGVIAATLQRLPLIRLYALGSVLSALLVIGAGFMSTVGHFTFKNDLINECTNLSSSDTFTFRWGLFGPSTSETLTPSEADKWCNDAWSHDTWSEVISLLVEILLGALFSAVAFAYYRQSLDPSSPSNASRAPSNQVRMNGYPAHYNPPYDPSVPNLGYNAAPMYAPPPGPPPQDDAFGKPPAYGGYGGKDEPFVGGDVTDVKEDPFSDFDGPSVPPRAAREERDVTNTGFMA